jgi:secreted trypsin-like serine protease
VAQPLLIARRMQLASAVASIAAGLRRRMFRVLALAVVPWFLCSLSGTGTNATAGPLGAPVVGGTLAHRGDWPDVVALLMEDGSLCSGTLLGADLVLTAAHCIEGVPVEVIIGSLDLVEPDGQRRAVKWSKAYPGWREAYDVGVVMLENPVFVKPRAVAQGCTTRELRRGTRLQLVGFGQTTAGATDDNTRLHAAVLEVVDATCAHDAACEPSIAPGGELVAGGHGADACFGDSGGPLYISTAAGPALIGVVSRGLAFSGMPCGEGGVFVRADKVVEWIESVTGRVVERVACDRPADGDGRADDDAGGCNAGGGVLEGGLAMYYALVCAFAMRRSRRIRRATTRTPWPRSR